MRASDIKRQKGRGAFNPSALRPQKLPIEILYLNDESLIKGFPQLICEDETFLKLPIGVEKIGGYGLKKTEKDEWMRLVKTGYGNYEWVYASSFKDVKPWSKILQSELDTQEKKVELLLAKNKEPELEPDNKFMILKLKVNGNQSELKAELTGKFVKPIKGHKNITQYLKHLVAEHGQNAINYEYAFQ